MGLETKDTISSTGSFGFQMCVEAYSVIATLTRELKHARFWDADGNRKWAVFSFNLFSRNHIYTAKYLFSIRDD